MTVSNFMRECILHFFNCVAVLIDLPARTVLVTDFLKSRFITCSIQSVELLGYVKEKVP